MREGDALSLPKGWKEVELGEIAYYVKDKVEADKLNSDNYISADNMIGNVGGITKSEYVPESGKSSYFIEGDILVSNIRPYFKKMWYASFSGGCSNDVFIIRIKDTSVDSKYLFYRLSNQDFFDFMMAGANGTKMPRGNKNSIITFKINLPPLETQKKIASILSGYDDLIENNLKRIKILEEMAQQTYEEWFVRMRFPGYETVIIDTETGLPEGDALSLPKGWEKVKLGDFAKITFGYPFKANDFNSVSKGTPIIRIRNIPKSETSDYTTEIVDDKYIVNNGDILIGMDGEFYLNFWTGNKGYLVQRVCRLVAVDYSNQGYLLEALRAPINYYQNSIDGATVAHLGKKHLDEIEIVLPNIDLSFFQNLMNQKINLSNQNQRLREARDILLPRLMMGMIEV